MYFRLLGPLEVQQNDHPVAVGGPRQRALLAILLLNPNEVMPTEELVRDLWDAPPETAENTLHAHISRLRKVLGPSRIITRRPGYLLQLDEGERDLEHFETLVAEGREALAAGDPEEAGRLLRDALGLWRGPPLAGLAPERFGCAEIKRLEEERMTAVEDRVEADLAVGRHVELVSELEKLTTEHPFRERLRGQLMLALYRCGRQAEALEVYRTTRKALVDNLGIEPSPALRRLESAILVQDPTLEPSRGALQRFPIFSRPAESQLIGRDTEVRQLSQIFESVRTRKRAHLVTVFGTPGIGKSRLAHEVAGSLGIEATTAMGDCGTRDETSFAWPLADLVRQLAGGPTANDISARLGRGTLAEKIALRLATLFAPETQCEWDDIVWATGKFFQALAEPRPLVIVFDDVHAASASTLNVIDYLTEWMEDAALLIVCLSRHELLDRRPAWGGGKPNATSLTLAPLSRQETYALVRQLDARRAQASQWERIVELADGNPLFVEEMLALRREQPESNLTSVSVTATVAARLSTLEKGDLEVLSRAALIGPEPSVAALEAIAREIAPGGLMPVLRRLVRRDFLRPAWSPQAERQAFRFRHVVVRDVAYSGMPRDVRATLHERTAKWLQRGGDHGDETEGLVGYHLEQAYHLGRDSGAASDRARRSLARRAATALASSRHRELGTPGLKERVGVLQRALRLLNDGDRARPELLADIGVDLEQLSDWEGARNHYTEAVRLARANGDAQLETYATLLLHLLSLKSGSDIDLDNALGATEEAWTSLRGQSQRYADRVQALLASMYLSAGRAARCEDLLGPLVSKGCAREARLVYMALRILSGAWMWGPLHVDDAISASEKLLNEDVPVRVEASVYRHLAVLQAMQSNFADARAYLERDQAILQDLGLRTAAAGMSAFHGMVELLADEPGEAERLLRAALKTLQRVSDRWYTGVVGAVLAQALATQRRFEEAGELIRFAERVGVRDAVATITIAGTRARVLASLGKLNAVAEGKRAVALAKRTDHTNETANAHYDLGLALLSLGMDAEASANLARAERLYAKKGNGVGVSRARLRRSGAVG